MDDDTSAVPQKVTDVANQTLPSIIGEKLSTSQLPAERQSQSVTSGPTKIQKWGKRGLNALAWTWKLFAELVTIVFLVTLWDSYRPKITIVPGPTFDQKEPFATTFIIENSGALPIHNVWFDRTWTYADQGDGARNVAFGTVKISQLKSLEQHAMLEPALGSPGTDKLTNMAPVTIVPMPLAHHSIILWFDVKYDTVFFGERSTTLYFAGTWDADNHFQWVPTGGADARTEGANAELLKRAIGWHDALAHQKPPPQPNNTPQQINGSVKATKPARANRHSV